MPLRSPCPLRTTSKGLFGKNLGADEAGLGTTADASGQDEIVFHDYVATLQMSSVQSPDNWKWFGTPTKPASPTRPALPSAKLPQRRSSLRGCATHIVVGNWSGSLLSPGA